MEQVCPRCQHIGYGKHKRVKGSILGGGSLIGLGIILFVISIVDAANSDITKSIATSIISAFIIILGLIATRNFFKYGKICPICKNENMYSIDEPKAHNLMSEHIIKLENNATDICTLCHHKGLRKNKPNMLGSIVVLISGILLLFSILIIHVNYPYILTDILVLIGCLIIIGTGIYGLSAHSKKGTCPSCKNKSFVPINSEQAKSLTNKDQVKAS